jgi:hypothetical protein
MSLGNTTETAALNMFLRGTDPSYRSGDTRHIALFTADPNGTDESQSLAAEADYGSYERVAVPKATSWTGTASPFTNTLLIQFPACSGGTNTITHFAVVDSGPTRATAVTMMISGQLTNPLNVASGIQPQFAPNALSISAD